MSYITNEFKKYTGKGLEVPENIKIENGIASGNWRPGNLIVSDMYVDETFNEKWTVNIRFRQTKISSNIYIGLLEGKTAAQSFSIAVNGKSTGIAFQGHVGSTEYTPARLIFDNYKIQDHLNDWHDCTLSYDGKLYTLSLTNLSNGYHASVSENKARLSFKHENIIIGGDWVTDCGIYYYEFDLARTYIRKMVL